MNATPTSAARKAPATARPTFEQMMALALDKAEERLARLLQIQREDEEWHDKDDNVDFAVSLALEQILRMKEAPPHDLSDFCTSWFRAGAVVNLCCQTFSRQACPYRWSLESARTMFDQLADLVEFTSQMH